MHHAPLVFAIVFVITCVFYNWDGRSLPLSSFQLARKLRNTPLFDDHDVCRHPQFDHFDPIIMKFYKERVRMCEIKIGKPTDLVNGSLVNLKPDLLDCYGRCLFFKNDTANKESEWFPTTRTEIIYDCDVIESRCWKKFSKNASNDDGAEQFYLHTQVVERPVPLPTSLPEGKQYSVHLIVIDSQSHGQMYRNMMKTLEFMLADMEATIFPYVNAMTLSSRDNALAWLFGKIPSTIYKTRYNLPPVEVDPYWESSVNCNRSIEEDIDKSLVGKFAKQGYITASVEDWFPVFSYGCKGFSKNPFHHSFMPYATAIENDKHLKNYMYHKQCLFQHRPAIDYLQQFIRAYPGFPKFSLTWFGHIGHNTEWGSLDLDQDMLNFLTANKEELDSSFVILAGDHGMRVTHAALTQQGRVDMRNPALLITVPRELRANSEFKKHMLYNSMELQTHLDTRATILDILKHQPKTNFTSFETLELPGELGQSVFRKQTGPRTCKHLPIIDQHCICQIHKTRTGLNFLAKDHLMSHKIAHYVVEAINEAIKHSGFTQLCDVWQFVKLDELTLIFEGPSTWEGILRVRSTINKYPAEFSIYVEEVNSTEYRLLAYDRVDTYGSRGDCSSKKLAKACDCLKQ